MNITGGRAKELLIKALAIGMSVFHLYTAGFGSFESMLQRSVHLAFAIALVFLMYSNPAFLKTLGKGILGKLSTLLLLAGGLLPLAYLVINNDSLAQRFQFITPLTLIQIVCGLALVVVVLEACRRVAGWILPLIIALFLIYPFIPGLPGVFDHNGYNIHATLDALYLTTFGIFGIPLAASANYIALFIIFGAFLDKSGLGKFIIDIANAVAGRSRGGPAKVAIIASGMMGSISGSAPANVLSTGVITIPLMKRVGYAPHQAGAIEAAASTAGPLLPPIMGSVVFLMAQYTNVPYSQLIWVALPAGVLFLFGVFLAVHWNALKYNIRGLDKSELPSFRKSFKEGFHLLLPIFVLLGLMISGKSPQFAVFYSIIAVVIVAGLRKSTRMSVTDVLEAMVTGAKGTLMVAIATAAVGMVVGVFELTGLALRVTQLAVGNIDSLLLGLLLTMIVSIVLGMAVPPSASYIVQVATTIPMVISFLTLNPEMPEQTAIIIAHFFVLYYSVMAVLTPPDALAAIAACGIAGSPFLKTAITGTRFAFVGFTVPFMFMYRPGILLQGGDFVTNMTDIAIAIVGIFCISVALEGYFLKFMSWIQRGMALAAGILLIFPGAATGTLSVVLLILLILWQLMDRKKVILQECNATTVDS